MPMLTGAQSPGVGKVNTTQSVDYICVFEAGSLSHWRKNASNWPHRISACQHRAMPRAWGTFPFFPWLQRPQACEKQPLKRESECGIHPHGSPTNEKTDDSGVCHGGCFIVLCCYCTNVCRRISTPPPWSPHQHAAQVTSVYSQHFFQVTMERRRSAARLRDRPGELAVVPPTSL